jgi:RNA 2',3'-cyclic 3'-phosphodiesterase
MIRSFLAIELSEGLKEIVAENIRELSQIPSKIKWVSPRQTHLTLKFFGSISYDTVEMISQTLSPIISDYPRFHITLKGLGAFPSLFRPRVIWLSLGGKTEILRGLHQAIEGGLVPLGIPKEERPFQGHLTLGRNKDNQVNQELYRRLSQWVKEETTPFEVDELVLFRSDLKPAGPEYSKLKTFLLSKGEKDIPSTIEKHKN